MSQAIIDKFTQDVKAKLREAFAIYDIWVPVDDVVIRCDIRGRCAGQAGLTSDSKPWLRFNREAILKYNEDMTKDTIAHEVAHTVCQLRPNLGKGHDFGWKRVCRRLGADDSRCHDMTLTVAKVVPSRRQNYILDSGRVCSVGPKHHKLIQAGNRTVFMRNPKEYIRAEQWEHYGKVTAPKVVLQMPGLNIVKSNVPATAVGATKSERAKAIYLQNKHLTRGQVLDLFIEYADLTKAGAATYYQNFKKAGI